MLATASVTASGAWSGMLGTQSLHLTKATANLNVAGKRWKMTMMDLASALTTQHGKFGAQDLTKAHASLNAVGQARLVRRLVEKGIASALLVQRGMPGVKVKTTAIANRTAMEERWKSDLTVLLPVSALTSPSRNLLPGIPTRSCANQRSRTRHIGLTPLMAHALLLWLSTGFRPKTCVVLQ